MKKLTVILPFFILICLLAACSSNETKPDERFDQYIDHWSNEEFSEMYNMLSKSAKENYGTEDVVDRYKNIYNDLEIDNLEITYDEPSDDQIDMAMDKGKATFPFHVEMTSIAGDISFDYKAKLIQEKDKKAEEDDAENWFVAWDPGYIFPSVQDGSDVNLETTEPKRGEILDQNRMPLALDDTVREVGIIPENLGDQSDSIIDKLADKSSMTVEEIEERLNQEWVEPDLFVPLKKFPKTEEDKAETLTNLDGVTSQEVTGRVYPLGKAASHLTGYIGKVTAEDLEDLNDEKYSSNDMVGKRGLESLFEERLKGEAGAEIYTMSDEGKKTTIAKKDVKNGENVITTINVNIQEAIYDAYDKDSGTAAAINPKTGETLALVSSPGFVPDDFLYGISQSKYDALKKDPDKPLLNRYSSTYAPGSSIKPITAAIGLENESIIPGEGIEINGLTWSNGEGWGDYKVHRVSESEGPVDVSDALVRSDNIYFAKKSVEMGADAFEKGLQKFGFGDDLPFDYPITSSSISSSGSIDDEVQLANTSYGQGEIEVSSLHLALMFSTFLNDGDMLEPTLLKNDDKSQVWQEDLVTEDETDLITDALHDVVHAKKGTANTAKNEEVTIAGKTGTAELKLSDDENGKENGWFVGYPEDDPNILIAMMIEGTQDKGGSAYTAEKVSNILQEIK